MQTSFTAEQLRDPALAECNAILRACVHCGFCTATCPTFVLLGDERDSPRGRIYLIKDMLETGRAANAVDALHLDRCLSCLSCMTTCPSGVDYMHLVDHARAHVARTHRRPPGERLVRALLAHVLPYPRRFRAALAATRVAGPLARGLIARLSPPRREPAGAAAVAASSSGAEAPGPVQQPRTNAPLPDLAARLSAMLELAPARLPRATRRPPPLPPTAPKRPAMRVALLAGCAQSVLAPGINQAAARLLARAGVEVVNVRGEGCCGALVHHMGQEGQARAAARRNVAAWTRAMERGGLDAIVVTASGCGTTVKDYGHLLDGDSAWRERARRVAALARDISQVLDEQDLGPPVRATGFAVAYHSACSLQHGQKMALAPRRLLETAGFLVKEVPEGHLCCGSAGTYNIMQPGLAQRLKARKLANLARTGAAVVATGNIGCITQLADDARPVVHTVELLDWAYGGPAPAAAAHVCGGAAPGTAAAPVPADA